MAKPRFQFSLRFIALWVTPYVALVALLLTWSPYNRTFLDWMARFVGVGVLTTFWLTTLVGMTWKRFFGAILFSVALVGYTECFGVTSSAVQHGGRHSSLVIGFAVIVAFVSSVFAGFGISLLRSAAPRRNWLSIFLLSVKREYRTTQRRRNKQ